MSRLVLLRHGLSLGNEDHRVTGKLDLPLSQMGIQEARRAAPLLSHFSFERAYSSFMSRAVQTKDIIYGELGISPPTLRTGLLDSRSYGDLEGCTKQEIEARFGAQALRKYKRGVGAESIPPNGESFESVGERVWLLYTQFLKLDMLRDFDSLVISHGNVLAALIKRLDGLDDDAALDVYPHHCTPIVYEFKPSFGHGGPWLDITARYELLPSQADIFSNAFAGSPVSWMPQSVIQG